MVDEFMKLRVREDSSFCTDLWDRVYGLFQTDEEMSHRVKKNRRSEDYNYWKKCSIEYLRSQEMEEKKERMAALHAEM